jgi:hypothetical protein
MPSSRSYNPDVSYLELLRENGACECIVNILILKKNPFKSVPIINFYGWGKNMPLS